MFKDWDLYRVAALRGHKDCLDIETVLGGFVLANAPDFIDDEALGMNYSPISSSGVLSTPPGHCPRQDRILQTWTPKWSPQRCWRICGTIWDTAASRRATARSSAPDPSSNGWNRSRAPACWWA